MTNTPQSRSTEDVPSTTDRRWALLTAIGLGLYFALLVLPRSAETPIEIAEDAIRPYQMAGAVLFVLSAVIPLLARPGLRAFVASVWRTRLAVGLMAVFGTSTVLSVVVHGDVLAAAYAGITFAVLVGCSLFWAMERRHLQMAAGVIALLGLTFAAVMLWRYGVTVPGRFVGSLTPNHFANIVLTAVIFGVLGPRLLRTLVIPIGIALVMPVNSRGALIAIAIAVALRWSIQLIAERRVAAIGVISCVVGLGALVFMHQGVQSVISDTAADVFAVDDLARGLGTGGTGRTQMWEDAWTEIAARPLAGAGFRAIRLSDGRLTTAHNAYLDLAQEIGIPLAVVVLLLIIGACAHRLRTAAAADELKRPHHLWIAAALVALAANAMLEVHLLNIGFPLGVAFMLLLMEPGAGARAISSARSQPKRPRVLFRSPSVQALEQAIHS